MEPISLSTTIAKPRQDVFEYLADVANHAEFSDHCMVDWHLTREDSYGHGAGARFRVKSRFDRFSYGDITLAELTPPERSATRARGCPPPRGWGRPAAAVASTASPPARRGRSRRPAQARRRSPSRRSR